MRLFLSVLLFVGLSSCTHSLHLSHVSDFSPAYKEYRQGTLVRAKSEQFTIMGIIDNTNYIDEAYQKIMKACPGGDIQGIVSQYSTSHGFFSWTNYLELQGLCVKASL